MSRLKQWTAGRVISARAMNAIRDGIVRMVVGGPGIVVNRINDRVTIELASGASRGGAGSVFKIHVADTKANLPSVNAPALGYVPAGPYGDPYEEYYVKTDSGWIGLTRWGST